MGRKKHSAQQEQNNVKKNIGKRLILVDKLLSLTSSFPPTNQGESWKLHMQIQGILDELMLLENHKQEAEQKDRHLAVQPFLDWLSDNGAQFDGIDIDEFPGYGFGLKAKKSFSQSSQLMKIPRKVLLSEDNARTSAMGSFIEKDPILNHMSNVSLSLFLVYEKYSKNSFWKPYFDMLPQEYTTILYFRPSEMELLKVKKCLIYNTSRMKTLPNNTMIAPSPNFEKALTLFRTVCRQYAYFYKKLQLAEYPCKVLKEHFTFEAYRWAVSTVMTRLNQVPSSLSGTGKVHALIPLWDMCNHENGLITTDFDEKQDCGVSYALRAFNPGDQIFIYYGDRSNGDLFLHNGFVYKEHRGDQLTITLGISSSDPLKDLRMQMLRHVGLAHVTQYTLYACGRVPSQELLAFLRTFTMDADELNLCLDVAKTGDLAQLANPALERAVELKALAYLRTRCDLLRAAYVRGQGRAGPPLSATAALHRQMIQDLKDSEVRVLDRAIAYAQNALDASNRGGGATSASMDTSAEPSSSLQ